MSTSALALVTTLCIRFAIVSGATTYGPTSTATAATNPTTIGGTLSTRQVTVTAKTSGGAAVGTGGDLFVAELYTNNASCTNNLYTYTCLPSCAPYTSPNVASPSCLSTSYIQARGSVSGGPNWVVGTVADNADGTYTVTYAPEVVGTYDLSIWYAYSGGLRGQYYDNMWFLNNPTVTRIDSTINFQWGTGPITTYGVDYVSVRWQGRLRPSYNQVCPSYASLITWTDSDQTYTIYFYADDGVRLWLDKRLVIDKWDTCCNETWANVALMANYLHDIAIDYRQIRGSATAQLSWSAPSVPKQIIPSTALYTVDAISGSPFNGIVVKPGDPPSSSQTTASGVALTTPITAGPWTLSNVFKVTAKDVFGNLQTSKTAGTFTVTATGPGAINGTIVYSGGASYTASWTANVTGAYLLYVKINGANIVASPFSVSVVPAATSAGNSIAYGSGLSTATVGQTASFYVQAKDAYGNNVTSTTDSVGCALSGTNAPQAGVTALGNGLYAVFYVPVVSGSLTLLVTIGSTAILTQSGTFSVTVAVGAPDAAKSTFTYLANATAGVSSTMTLTARDVYGNQLVTGGTSISTWAVSLTGPATLSASSIVYAGSGRYTATFTPTLAGSYKATVSMNGTQLSGSPVTIVAVPGAPVASTSSAAGASLGTAVSGVLQTFTVTVRDSQTNLIANNTATVTAVTGSSCGSVSGTAVWSGNGVYTVTYTPTTKYLGCTLTVKVGGTNIPGSPFVLNVYPGAASAANSNVTGTGLSTSVAGTAVSLTITLHDASANALVTGGNLVNVTVQQPGGAGLLPIALTDYGTGIYSAAYTPTLAGSHTVTVQVAVVGGLYATYYADEVMTAVKSANVLEATVNHNWGYAPAISGLPADHFSVRWVGKIMPSYSEVYQFTVSLNANTGAQLYVNGQAVISSWASASGDGDVSGTISLTASTLYDIALEFHAGTGQAECVLWWSSPSTTLAVVPSTALYYVGNIAGSPYTVAAVTQGALNRTKTTATGAVLTSGTIPYSTPTQVTITARDTYGNLDIAGGQQALFSASLAAVYTSTTYTPVITNVGSQSGQYLVNFTATEAGSFTLSIYLNGAGNHIYGSPWQLTVPVGPTYAKKTVIAGTGATQAIAGVPTQFVLTVYDSSGNRRTVGGDFWNITMLSAGTSVPVAIRDNADGTYLCNYTATVKATYTTSIAVDAAVIGSSFTTVVAANAAVASNTIVVGGTPPAPTSNSKASFKVITYDASNNALATGGRFLFVNMTDKTNAVYRATVTDANNGTYVVNYTLPAAGMYVYNVLLASGSGTGGDGLYGEYYNNRWLSGGPVDARVDKFIDFQWGSGLITPSAQDYVSVRWTGYVSPLYAQTYTFYINVIQGRLWVNNILIIDNWNGVAGETNATYAIPTATILYPIKVEFRKTTGNAWAALSWSSTSQTKQVIPQAQLFSSATPISGAPYTITLAS
ncbi:hypothetical protein PBRA_002447 [Plasmodiophora brassicae]|uniref:PA14 domain-containing protein n=1 Tax=Plasmodiophora brassicae TaxID=37360 RepID=A0A0G4J3W3_PLABS|nr:hypothetical protein PBRA_002447 [Plasmodiophora brassicae]